MRDHRLYHLYPVVLVLTAICVGYLMGTALLPLVLSLVLAYLCLPVAQKLESWGSPRTLASLVMTILVFGGLLAGVLSFIPIFYEEVQTFFQQLPDTLELFLRRLEGIAQALGQDVEINAEAGMEFLRKRSDGFSLKALAPVTDIARQAFTGVVGTFIVVMNFFLMPVFFFYILNNHQNMIGEVQSLVPERYKSTVFEYWYRIDTVLSGFIRGQLTVCLILAVLLSTALSILGLQFGLLIGVVAGFLNIIPYFGSITGFLIAMIVALTNAAGVQMYIWLTVIYLTVQGLEGSILSPKIVGDRVGVPPLVALIAVIVGGNLFGLVGMVLGIPVAGILRIAYYELKSRYKATFMTSSSV